MKTVNILIEFFDYKKFTVELNEELTLKELNKMSKYQLVELALSQGDGATLEEGTNLVELREGDL